VSLSLCGAPVFAQGQRKAPVFPAELALVKVTVSVEDRRGQAVGGLSASDFTLREDGRRQAIAVCVPPRARGGDTSLALALLIDTSGSMVGSLRHSQQAVRGFLAHLPQAREVLVVPFEQQAHVLRFAGDRPEELTASLAGLTTGGNTALRDAIVSTLAVLRSRERRTVMVLLTDGADTASRTSPAQLERMLVGSPVTLYPIAFRGGGRAGEAARRAYASLERLARLTGGRAFRLAGERALPAVFSAILDEIRGQYVLGYVPTRPPVEGRYRTIQVEIRGHRGLTLRHRPGYRLPPR
jgi:Ca-activated chloride channel family protein